MPLRKTNSGAKNQLLDQVLEAMAALGFPQDKEPDLHRFTELFWQQLAIPDWQSKDPKNIAGCCYDLWLFFNESKSAPCIRVFNPNVDENAWVSNGTLLFVRQSDMPFLVDSLRLRLLEGDYQIHLIKSTLLKVKRSKKGKVEDFASLNEAKGDGWQQEALIMVEISLISDDSERGDLRAQVARGLSDLSEVVADYEPSLQQMDELIARLEQGPKAKTSDEILEFLAWLKDSRFTFLGYQEYKYQKDKAIAEPDTALGFFKDGRDYPVGDGSKHSEFIKNDDLIAFTKANIKSHIHRNVYPDYIFIKLWGKNGKAVGEARILGLFTYSVHTTSPTEIPLIRQKIKSIYQKSGLDPRSHDGKNLARVIESFPKDELFQASFDELFEAIIGVAWINERKVVRLFCREDYFGKFFSCLIYVPREIYNTRMRMQFEALISRVLSAEDFESTTYFSESILARAHIVFKLGEQSDTNIDIHALQASVVEVTRSWEDRFETALIEAFGEEKGINIARRYSGAFSGAYQEHYDARSAVYDIEMINTLKAGAQVSLHLFHPHDQADNNFRFKVMHGGIPLELSDVIPILEHLGLRVIGEHPFKIATLNGERYWLHDFELLFNLPVNIEVGTVAKLFENAFEAVLDGVTESDAFNRLVLGARLHWREVLMLRAYAAYMKQTAFNYGHDFIADTLVNQLEITRNLVALFKASFDPRVNDGQTKANERIERLKEKILSGLENVANLNEDKILRRYFELISATLRTNFYQKNEEGNEKSYLSFKFHPKSISDIPEPKPEFEIFVYSPRMEGVHLRGGKVARGGLRWSDRLQDYRTEVLGLVKAQQVKNAVIVPSGAKGGFVAKKIPNNAGRDEVLKEGIACYQYFIQGLLDVTDNIVGGEVVRPESVICKDDPDPYLVVAADKGTATFSDIANEISLNYGHWLGDAFASGGSQGYDHKKMGITAKGAWVSVQRHFRELGKNIQKEDFSVIGIGDMAGDVFGNGMLLSEHICLLAAFNHLHIFIDPNPNPKESFKERQRLFDLPKSAWSDYREDLISKGGGVFSRSAKSITITPEMKKAFNISDNKLAPNELINALLKSQVELIWNGGIGTYVKSSQESHAQVGDKANDALRVDGCELNCKVFGEGGNLGMTQLGRVEFTLNGGACNTDFIDNSAGVDCSDHEVNIKILLQNILSNGDITQKQRNKLLEEMTDEVSQLVLANNYAQTQALSLAAYKGEQRVGEYKRFIHYLEDLGKLKRHHEFLPADEEIKDRKKQGLTFSRPELAVLLCYSKVLLKEAFFDAGLADHTVFKEYLYSAFPNRLRMEFDNELAEHPLKQEIVATQVANDFVNTLGITGALRTINSTGVDYLNLAKAFVAVKKIFKFADFERYLIQQDHILSEDDQARLLENFVRRLRRGVRWIIRNRDLENGLEEDISYFASAIEKVNESFGDCIDGKVKEQWAEKCNKLENMGVELQWTQQLAMPANMFSALSVVAVAQQTGHEVPDVSRCFFYFYEHLELNWLATQLTEISVESQWQAMARESYIDDLDFQLRSLTFNYLKCRDEEESLKPDTWLESQAAAVARWANFVEELKNIQDIDFAIFSVASKSLADLARCFSRD